MKIESAIRRLTVLSDISDGRVAIRAGPKSIADSSTSAVSGGHFAIFEQSELTVARLAGALAGWH